MVLSSKKFSLNSWSQSGNSCETSFTFFRFPIFISFSVSVDSCNGSARSSSFRPQFLSNYPPKSRAARPPSHRDAHMSFQVGQNCASVSAPVLLFIKSHLHNCQVIAPRACSMTLSNGRTPVGQNDDGPKPPTIAEGAHRAHNSILVHLWHTRQPG